MKPYNWINPEFPDSGGWKRRHKHAIECYSPMAQAMRAWCQYAEAHANKYGSQIGDDHMLGDAWAAWGFALLRLLNGDCGALDCGTLDTLLRDNLSEQGWDTDMERRNK